MVWTSDASSRRLAAAGSQGPYDRERDLSRLLRLWPSEVARLGEHDRVWIVQRLRLALKQERKLGIAGHWAYDLTRHAALARALRAETAALSAAPPRPASERASPAPREAYASSLTRDLRERDGLRCGAGSGSSSLGDSAQYVTRTPGKITISAETSANAGGTGLRRPRAALNSRIVAMPAPPSGLPAEPPRAADLTSDSGL